MMKLLSRALLLGLFLPGLALAQQRDVPLRSAKERQVFEEQTAELNAAFGTVLAEAASATVSVRDAGGKRLAFGTVVGDGSRILTKWSEIANADEITIRGNDQLVRSVTLAGIFEDEDIALLALAGEPMTPAGWTFEPPVLGQFLAAPQPDGSLAGWGVVSVLERNLRDTDHAYLGVTGNPGFTGPGVKVAEVAGDSGAAAAGLLPGDIILKAGEREISGLMELRSSLIGLDPGSRIELLVKRGRNERTFDVLLGNRPALPQFPAARLRQMERMGGPISSVATAFSRVIQTDMRLLPDQAGGPVVDLEGRVVGITLARADRTRSFVMPAANVNTLLEREPTPPAIARAAADQELPFAMAGGMRQPMREARPEGPQAMPQAMPSPDRMRRQLSDVRRLRDLLFEELEMFEMLEDAR